MDTPKKYDATGIAQTDILMNQSPPSNPGLVYQPANIPSNPGSSLPGQTASTLVFQAPKNQRRIRISMTDIASNITPFDPGQNAGSIEILNDQGQFVASVGDNSEEGGAAFEGQDFFGNPVADFIRPNGLDFSGVTGPGAILNVIDNAIDDISPTAIFTASTVSSRSDFGLIFNLEGAGSIDVYVSNGTNPNGNLSGNIGDICFNGPSGQPFYCSGSTTWIGM